MNMDLWVREQIATADKKAMPLLSYPAVQQQFITVDQLIHSSSEMALGVRLMADRYKMPFATTYMDLSVEAEAFGAKCTYHTSVMVLPSARRTLPVRPAPSSGISSASASSWVEMSWPVIVGMSFV